MWMHLERNATDGIHFIELRVIHAQMTSLGLWPASPAGCVGRKRSRECWGMNKLIQVAPEWMSPRMMANDNLLCRMRKCDTSDGTAAELLNIDTCCIQVQLVSQLGSALTTCIRLFKIPAPRQQTLCSISLSPCRSRQHHSRFDSAGTGLAIKVINNTMHKESGEDLCPWLGCTSPERATKPRVQVAYDRC